MIVEKEVKLAWKVFPVSSYICSSFKPTSSIICSLRLFILRNPVDTHFLKNELLLNLGVYAVHLSSALSVLCVLQMVKLLNVQADQDYL